MPLAVCGLFTRKFNVLGQILQLDPLGQLLSQPHQEGLEQRASPHLVLRDVRTGVPPWGEDGPLFRVKVEDQDGVGVLVS